MAPMAQPAGSRAFSISEAVNRTTERRRQQEAKGRVIRRVVAVPLVLFSLVVLVLLTQVMVAYAQVQFS